MKRSHEHAQNPARKTRHLKFLKYYIDLSRGRHCALANTSCGMHGKPVCGYCITHSNVNRGSHIRTCADRRDKEKRRRRESREECHRPGIEGTPEPLNRRGAESTFSRSSVLPAPSPPKCVFSNLALSYCTYDESSKFSEAISSKRRETIPREDPGRLNSGRPECSSEDQRFPETRPKGDYVCANTRGIPGTRTPGLSRPFCPSVPRPIPFHVPS